MPLPADHSLAVREAVVRRQLAAPSVTSIIANRAFGQRVPADAAWPYTKCGAPMVQPFEATGWGGGDEDLTIHAFANGPDEAPCSRLAAAVVEALSQDDLDLGPDIALVSLDWVSTQIIPDEGDSGAYHAIIRFRIVTTG